jgi:ribonucleotide reductase beta subunit family protein with ferritin-like domain
LYSKLQTKLSDNEMHAMMDEAVQHEIEFACSALPVSLLGMNCEMMQDYIRFCADRLLVALGAPKLYNAINPFVRCSPLRPQRCSTSLTANLTLTRTS